MTDTKKAPLYTVEETRAIIADYKASKGMLIADIAAKYHRTPRGIITKLVAARVYIKSTGTRKPVPQKWDNVVYVPGKGRVRPDLIDTVAELFSVTAKSLQNVNIATLNGMAAQHTA